MRGRLTRDLELALFFGPARVRCDVPVVPGGVANGSGPFPVSHISHIVKAHSSGFDCTLKTQAVGDTPPITILKGKNAKLRRLG